MNVLAIVLNEEASPKLNYKTRKSESSIVPSGQYIQWIIRKLWWNGTNREMKLDSEHKNVQSEIFCNRQAKWLNFLLDGSF